MVRINSRNGVPVVFILSDRSANSPLFSSLLIQCATASISVEEVRILTSSTELRIPQIVMNSAISAWKSHIIKISSSGTSFSIDPIVASMQMAMREQKTVPPKFERGWFPRAVSSGGGLQTTRLPGVSRKLSRLFSDL